MPDLGTRRWWALGGVSLAVFCVGLDGTVVSVALRQDHRDPADPGVGTIDCH
jgi:hypothetical protein